MAKTVDTKSQPMGNKMVRSFGADNASGIPLNDKESRDGRKMGGSTTNLAHSLSDDSATQKVS